MNALIASCADSQLSFAAKQIQADVQLTRNVTQSQIAELQLDPQTNEPAELVLGFSLHP
jgi:hypothetical protein